MLQNLTSKYPIPRSKVLYIASYNSFWHATRKLNSLYNLSLYTIGTI